MSSSLGRIAAIGRTTFTELARLRVFYVLVLFALVLIISSAFLARISFQQELQVPKDIALGAINFFISMLDIVATAHLLPRDLHDRLVYTVLSITLRHLALFFTLTKASVLVSLTLCISSFATSNIFTISAMAMVYLVRHLESVARDYWLHQRAAGWFVRTFLAVVAFFFPDLQAFNLSD